tara:strand:- start:1301 stop:2314 length:1014 start_codon:yes stop_codon:yes gene_type:complete
VIDFQAGQVSQAQRHGEIMRRRNSGETTFAFAVNDWCKKSSTKRPGQPKSKGFMDKGDWFKRRIGSKQIEDISDQDVKKLVAELRSIKGRTRETIGASGINGYITVYNAVMNHAVHELKMIQSFPRWLKGAEEVREYYPEVSEIGLLINELKTMGFQNPLRADLVAMGFHTQLRNTNARTLRIDEVSRDLNFLSIPARRMKNNRHFERPLNQEAKKIVQRNIERGYALQAKYSWLDPIEHVFVQDSGTVSSIGKPLTQSALVGRSWHVATKRAGLPESFTYHSLRHAGATFLVREGIDLKMVATLLGHSSESSTWRYRHVSTKESQRASELTSGVNL